MIRNEILSVFSSAKWSRKEFRAFLYSAEWFGTKLQSSECFSFLRKSSGRNSELFCLPQTGSKHNSERLPLRATGVIPKKRIKISIYSVFHGINFSRKIATLTATQGEKLSLCLPSTATILRSLLLRLKHSLSPSFTFYWVSFHLRVSHFPFPSETYLRIHAGGTFRFRSTIFLTKTEKLSAQLCWLFLFLICSPLLNVRNISVWRVTYNFLALFSLTLSYSTNIKTVPNP